MWTRSKVDLSKGATPEEVWSRSKVDLSHLHAFGCRAYALTPENQRKKIDAKSKPYIMVGYCKYSKGYKLADPLQPGKVITARSVEFLESVAGGSAQKFNVESSVSSSVIVPLSLEPQLFNMNL
jgi:hypothetical protein